MDIAKLIDFFRARALRPGLGELLVQHLPDGRLLVTEGTVVVHGHEADFAPLLQSFKPLDERSGRLFEGGNFRDLERQLKDIWDERLEPTLVDLIDTSVEIGGWSDRLHLLRSPDGGYRFIESGRAGLFVASGHTFRSVLADPKAPVWVFSKDEPMAMVLPVVLGDPLPDAMKYIASVRDGDGREPSVADNLRRRTWDYRLLRDSDGVRVVVAYYHRGRVVGYGKANPVSGRTAEEVRDNLAALVATLGKPTLVEIDGALVEERHA